MITLYVIPDLANLRSLPDENGLERTEMRLYGALLLLIVLPCECWAHKLDPRSIDRYAEILLSPDGGRLYYVTVYGQIGTDDARRVLEPDRDGLADSENQAIYLAQRRDEYTDKQTLRIDGEDVDLEFSGGVSGMILGHGGMEANRAVLIYDFKYPAGMPRDATVSFHYEDRNFTRLYAWKQIRVLGLQGVRVPGHQPYGDMIPYDYRRLDMEGIMPTTRSVSLDIYVPSKPTHNSPPVDSYAEALMEVGWSRPDPPAAVFLTRVLMLGITLALLIGIIAVFMSQKRMRPLR